MKEGPDIRHTTFGLVSLLLGYPDDDAVWNELPDAVDEAKASGIDGLAEAGQALMGLGRLRAAERYVQTFDFSEEAALYLTAHETGDSRSRGQALLELRRVLAGAGYFEDPSELPDFLPLLFEFLSVSGAGELTKDLEARLAVACARIAARISPDNPYAAVIGAACAILPPASDEKLRELESGGEPPDLEDLPYPVHYE